MGWSYRKSFGSGPFRVNFSKSGVSYSVGVKGARVNVGPRGTYVNLSSHGISYRRKIQGANPPQFQNPGSTNPHDFHTAIQEGHNIASADIYQLTDTDFKDFIRELSEKAGNSSYVGLLGVLPLVVFIPVLAFTTFGTKTVISQPVSDSVLVKVTSPIDAYIRESPNPKSAVVKTASTAQTFILIDSANNFAGKIYLPLHK